MAAASGSAESESSSTSITDDAAVFRQYAKLKAELGTEADALNRDTGVLTLIKTVAFVTADTTASQAHRLAEAETQADNRPVAAVLYVRGNRSAGIGTNSAFDAIVPAFELASLPNQGAAENADPAEQISEIFRRLHMLVRRYTDKTQHAVIPHSNASNRIAERWLLATVLAISAAIVGICAWCSRHGKPVN